MDLSEGDPLPSATLEQRIDRLTVQIQQVILNLIRNAIDATEEAEIRDGIIAIGTRTSEQEDFIEAWVVDHGSGVSEEVAEQLFDPFVTTKRKGTGMGLSISRTIVDAHGGKLKVRRINNTTEFSFSLPAAIGENE